MLIHDFGNRGEHQQECHATLHGIQSGRALVVMPTGAGKSWNEYLAVLDGFARSPNYEISAILSPRIALAVQHIKNFHQMVTTKGFKRVRYLCVHSGRDDVNDFEFEMDGWPLEVVTTTTIDEIQAEIQKSQNNDFHLMVFATYHSYDRLNAAMLRMDIKGDTLVNDECHYLIQENFEWILNPKSPMPFARVLNFTATSRENIKAENGVSMTNRNRFGPLVHRNTAYEMIERGVIVAPRLYRWHTAGSGDANTDRAHLVEQILKIMNPTNNNEIKLLVNANGTEFIEKFVAGLTDFWKAIEEQIDVFALTSAMGPIHNGVKMKNRRAFIEAVNASKRCVVLHYDTLSEGIDVDGFTDILQFRFPDVAKTCQQIGRGTRVHQTDREALNEGKIKPNNPKGWVKPYCRVHVLHSSEVDADTNSKIEELIVNLRTNGFNVVEEIVEDRNNGVNHSEVMGPDTGNERDLEMTAVDWDVDLKFSYSVL